MGSRMPTSMTTPASRRPWRRGVTSLVAAVGIAGLVGACSASHSTARPAAVRSLSNSSSSSSSSGSGTPAPSTSSSPVPAATITTAATEHNGMNPTSPVALTVANGTFTSVTMTNAAGTHVSAALGQGKTTWRTTEALGYGKTYTILAHAAGANGRLITRRTKFTTLDPATTTDIDLDRMGGYSLDSGSTYGVAIVPVVHFELAVQNEAAAQKALSVTTSKPVTGRWSWIDDKDVAYRPESYWPAHTSVTVSANEYGVDLGHRNYGSSDKSIKFTIGRKQVTVADDNAPKSVDKVRVYDAAGTVLQTMNTSMGQHSGETVAGQWINFYTLRGTYTVLEHDNPAIMDSQSYGLPADAPHGYGKLTVPFSTKISTDGIYLHEFNSTIYQQDHAQDVSEGCLNLRTSDATWFYDHSLVGDPVVVHGAAGAPKIQPWEGGYWSIPWTTWLSRSAPH
jgi:lipoprotein-anchoring transpeptidase ErfK/SrfK